jgi:hypothetical protein
MHAPFLVAALSGGLREGVGHVTLVSNPEIIGGESASRVVGLVSTVRNAEEAVVIGEDYIGISNKSAVQVSSNRIASEALLLCNLRTRDLSEDRLRHLVERLEARLDAIQELGDDLPARATRTVLASPTLDRWLNLDGFHKLPPYYVSEHTVGEDHSRGWTRFLIPAAGVVVIAAVVAFLFGFLHPSPKAKGPDGGKKPAPAVAKAQDRVSEEIENWLKEVKNIEISLGRVQGKDYASILKHIDIYMHELEVNKSSWPQEHYEKAVIKLQSLLSVIMTKVRGEIGSSLRQASEIINGPGGTAQGVSGSASASECLQELDSLKGSIETQSALIRQISSFDQMLKNLLPGATAVAPTNPVMPEGELLSQVLVKKVYDKLRLFAALSPDFINAFDWLRSVARNRENFLSFITKPEEKEEVRNVFETMSHLKLLDDTKLSLLFISLDYTNKLVSCELAIGDTKISVEQQMEGSQYRICVPIKALYQKGKLVLRYSAALVQEISQKEVVPKSFLLDGQNVRAAMLSRRGVFSIPPTSTSTDQYGHPSEWVVDGDNPDVRAIMKLEGLIPKTKRDSRTRSGER